VGFIFNTSFRKELHGTVRHRPVVDFQLRIFPT